MNIEQIILIGFIGAIESVTYYQKFDSYNCVWKPMIMKDVNKGSVSLAVAQERLSNVRKRMYFPFPIDIISMIKYLKS